MASCYKKNGQSLSTGSQDRRGCDKAECRCSQPPCSGTSGTEQLHRNRSRLLSKMKRPAFRNGTKKISHMTARNLTLRRRSMPALLFYSDSSSNCFPATNSKLRVPLTWAFNHISLVVLVGLTTCSSASNSRQTKLATSWWASCSVLAAKWPDIKRHNSTWVLTLPSICWVWKWAIGCEHVCKCKCWF